MYGTNCLASHVSFIFSQTIWRQLCEDGEVSASLWAERTIYLVIGNETCFTFETGVRHRRRIASAVRADAQHHLIRWHTQFLIVFHSKILDEDDEADGRSAASLRTMYMVSSFSLSLLFNEE